jgi:hypothetical protein
MMNQLTAAEFAALGRLEHDRILSRRFRRIALLLLTAGVLIWLSVKAILWMIHLIFGF